MCTGWEREEVGEHSRARPVRIRLKEPSNPLFTMFDEFNREGVGSAYWVIERMGFGKLHSLDNRDREPYPCKFLGL